MSETLGVGIVGCGNISTAYLELASLFAGYEVRAVADLNLDSAQAQAARFGVRARSVEALLADDDIDIILNLTIPAAHSEVTSAALHAGKHVYSEKPLVLSLSDGERIAALAAQKGLRVGSAPDTFLGGSHQLARALIDAGEVGEISSGTAFVMSAGMEHWHPNPDFFFKPGAGPVLDLGPYYIGNLVQLLGPVAAVSAFTGSARPTRTIANGPRLGEEISVETPTTIHAVMHFQSGAIITLAASWDVQSHSHPLLELYGSKGTLRIPDPNHFAGDVVLEKAGQAASMPPSDHPFGVINRAGEANYRGAGLADMVQAIAQNRPHRCSLAFALHVVDVMTAILEAGESERVIRLQTSCERPEALPSKAALALMAQAEGRA